MKPLRSLSTIWKLLITSWFVPGGKFEYPEEEEEGGYPDKEGGGYPDEEEGGYPDEDEVYPDEETCAEG